MTVTDKLGAYKARFAAMPTGQLVRVLRELLALAPKYLPQKPEEAEAHYAVAGIAISELSKRTDFQSDC